MWCFAQDQAQVAGGSPSQNRGTIILPDGIGQTRAVRSSLARHRANSCRPSSASTRATLLRRILLRMRMKRSAFLRRHACTASAALRLCVASTGFFAGSQSRKVTSLPNVSGPRRTKHNVAAQSFTGGQATKWASNMGSGADRFRHAKNRQNRARAAILRELKRAS